MEMETRAWPECRLEIREADGVSRITGRAVPYGDLSVDMGGWREIIVPGAFQIEGEDIRSLWQHDMSKVLGRTSAGTMSLTEDERGIYPDITPPATSWAQDALVSLKRGDVSGFSFGFWVLEDEWLVMGREVLRRVLRGELVEVSPVTFPAYPTTSAQVRSKAAELRAQIAAGGAGQETGENEQRAEAERARARREAERNRALKLSE